MANARQQLSIRSLYTTELFKAAFALVIAETMTAESNSISFIAMLARLQSYVSIYKVGVVMAQENEPAVINVYTSLIHATAIFGLLTATNLMVGNRMSFVLSAGATLLNGVVLSSVARQPGYQETIKNVSEYITDAPRKLMNGIWGLFSPQDRTANVAIVEHKKTI